MWVFLIGCTALLDILYTGALQVPFYYYHYYCYCLSNAQHSSIGQNIKSHTVSGLRYPLSGLRSPARV